MKNSVSYEKEKIDESLFYISSDVITFSPRKRCSFLDTLRNLPLRAVLLYGLSVTAPIVEALLTLEMLLPVLLKHSDTRRISYYNLSLYFHLTVPY